jgi:Uma2 family endonuclease
MSAATTFPLMTVEQYDALPEPTGNFYYELHFGKLVKMGKAKQGHYLLQRNIRDLLQKQLNSGEWIVDMEMAYTLTGGYDARAADVAVVSKKTFEKIPLDGWLDRAPDLVAFVKSRSNTPVGIERAAIDCLTHGAKAVWHVRYDPDVVQVYTAASKKEYVAGQSIPLPRPMTGSIRVKDIFRRVPR